MRPGAFCSSHPSGFAPRPFCPLLPPTPAEAGYARPRRGQEYLLQMLDSLDCRLLQSGSIEIESQSQQVGFGCSWSGSRAPSLMEPAPCSRPTAVDTSAGIAQKYRAFPFVSIIHKRPDSLATGQPKLSAYRLRDDTSRPHRNARRRRGRWQLADIVPVAEQAFPPSAEVLCHPLGLDHAIRFRAIHHEPVTWGVRYLSPAVGHNAGHTNEIGHRGFHHDPTASRPGDFLAAGPDRAA